MLKSKRPSMESCGTPDVIVLSILKKFLTLHLCLLLVRKFFINCKDRLSKSYASSLTVNGVQGVESLTEAVAKRCSVKMVFCKISQNSHENTCARVSFLKKLRGLGLQLY